MASGRHGAAAADGTAVAVPTGHMARFALRCDTARAVADAALSARLAWTGCACKAHAHGASADVVWAMLEVADAHDPRTAVEA